MTEAEIKQTIATAIAVHETIYVINWGATMTLADFFIIKDIQGSMKQVALLLSKKEYSKGMYVEERAIPTEKVCINSAYAVRIKNGKVQIHYGFSGWKNAEIWNGEPEYQNTCD